jgi:rhamnosyltransferase
MKLSAVVILYYPDKDLAMRIGSYVPFVDRLFIYDNSENNENVKPLIQPLLSDNKVKYFHDGDNKGISIRLNQAIDMALNNGDNWLLTMDQDSYFDNGLDSYARCIENCPNKENTAMFGVSLTEHTTTPCLPTKVPHLITSGSILNLSLISAIGKFDEALFIDKVDHEYCWRSRQKGFQIIRFENIFMHHSLGTVSYHRSFKNLEQTPRVLHSPIRMYYIIRNYFYLRKHYRKHFATDFKELDSELINRIKNNFLYGKQKLKLVKYLFRGYYDYMNNKMGKIDSGNR